MQYTSELFTALAVSLGLTLLVEMILAIIIGPRHRRSLLIVLLVNLITNPAVVLLYYLNYRYLDLPQLPVIILLEVSAVTVEAFIYYRCDKNRNHPILFSILLNAISYTVGIYIL